MREFKVGDRVKVLEKVDGITLTNQTGIVIDIGNHYPRCGVEFDKRLDRGGHDCSGKGKLGYCRWGSEKEFELVNTDWDE